MIRQFELVEKVRAYDPAVDEDLLNRAYVFSMKAHGSQTRASGDPYFSHPLEVAGILTAHRLDTASIVTALLHDTIEDTEATVADIQRLFGDDIARLVDGVTKLSQLELQSDRAKQAENFRKLVLAMSRDIRVLLVKLADRLHNMRTLDHVPSEEKRRVTAHETMEIYAPLAERIGMHDIKTELEDLAFAHMLPDARDSVIRRLEFLRSAGGGVVERVLGALRQMLVDGGITAEVSGREKTPYAIWRKMQRKQVGFELLSDIMAFRVVVDGIDDCYQALGCIHGRCPLVPGRFKDYISTPKPNGYRSLHTDVLGPENQRIEIQIRTREMHEVAERGVAAHWQYKQGVTNPVDGRKYRWLQELLDILDTAGGPEEFLEHTKLEMFQDQVFCFSPKGEIFALPYGATTVDFAYAVHSEVGGHCVGAQVNGRLVPLRTQLQNGDQVEILTSKNQAPAAEWEQMVVTGKARSHIRRYVRGEQRMEYVRLGQQIIEQAFRQVGYAPKVAALEGVLAGFRCEQLEDLYAQVGEGRISGRDVVQATVPGERAAPRRRTLASPGRRKAAEDHAVPIRGLIEGVAVHKAKCCYPLPGDRIVGIMATGKGVTIHTIDCDTLVAFAESPELWVDVAWDTDGPAGSEVGRLKVVLANARGSLGDLASVIARHEGNISNLKITNRNFDFFDMDVDVEVLDVKHLTNIIAALRATPSINSVKRART